MGYSERTTAVRGAVLWLRTAPRAPRPSRILPDGCLDLIWDGERLFVAGPDTRARWHESRADAAYVAVRFGAGTGPALLGVPADSIRDTTPALADLWSAAAARRLTDRVAADPAAALQAWVRERATVASVDPIGPAVSALATAGVPVAAMADELGLSERALHRRCARVFGYGPRHLTRVLRLRQALDQAGAGAGLAHAAAVSGYADQAHLTRDCRDLAGTTPTVLLRELRGGRLPLRRLALG